MRILTCLSDTRPEPWLQGLRAALPGADGRPVAAKIDFLGLIRD